jgi:hypothetical protein
MFTVHNAVAQQRKDHRADAKIHQVFHNDIARVFCSCKAGFYHGEAALHEKYQDRADQKPN